MTIEEAVKQSKFENEFHKAAINLLFTSSWLYNINALHLKQHSLTPEQYNVLRILRGSHPKKLMLAEITTRMIDKSSNATRLVEKLRQKNLVSREICEGNRRWTLPLPPRALPCSRKLMLTRVLGFPRSIT